MQVEIIERGETRVRFRLVDNAGKEIEQRALPIGPLLDQMRRQKKGLEYVLAREVGAMLPTDQASLAASVAVVGTEAASVTLADLYDHFSPADHEHEADERYAPNPHGHRVEGIVGLQEALQAVQGQLQHVAKWLESLSNDAEGLQERVAAAERGTQSATRETGSLMNVVSLNRERVDTELASLKASIDGLGRQLAHTHPELVTRDQVAEYRSQLWTAVNDIESRVTARLDGLRADIEATPAMAAQDIAAAVDARLVERGKSFTVREISGQKVDGKRRFIVEEV